MITMIISKLLGFMLRLVFKTIPGTVITVFKVITDLFGHLFKTTAFMMRLFVIELVVFEGIFEILPAFVGEKIYENRLLMGIYSFFTSVQWNKEICNRATDYLGHRLGSDLSKLSPVVIACLCLCSVGIIVFVIIVAALRLNIRYLIIFFLFDLSFLVIKFAFGLKARIQKTEKVKETKGWIPARETLEFGEAGIL